MKATTAALVGLSGVGKSTVARQLASGWSFRHLGASELIRASRGMSLSHHDKLREAGIDENQQLLIDAFRVSTAQESRPILLDAHTLIETSNGIALIPPAVFKALCVTKMVFLVDLPMSILERRQLDEGRVRPQIELADLAALQERALLSAMAISNELDAPLLVCRPGRRDEIGQFLFG